MYNNVQHARKLDAPLFIVEGSNDGVAPLAEAKQVEAAAAGPKALAVRRAPIVRVISTGATP